MSKDDVFVRRWWKTILFPFLLIVLVQPTPLVAADHGKSVVSEMSCLKEYFQHQASSLSVAVKDALDTVRLAFVTIRAQQSPDPKSQRTISALPDSWRLYVLKVLREIETVRRPEHALRQHSIPVRSGSGVLLGDGHILTSYEVAAGANRLIVETHKHHEYPAEVVWKNPEAGLAVLKIDSDKTAREPFAEIK